MDSLYHPEPEHKDGIPWYEAPIPSWLHFCMVQTRGWTGRYGLTQVERCACGAIRISPHRTWDERNSRRKN